MWVDPQVEFMNKPVDDPAQEIVSEQTSKNRL